MTIEERAKAIGELADLLGDKTFTGSKCVMFVKFLSELSDEEFIQAFYQVGKRCKFMPTPLEFIKLVKKEADDDDINKVIVGLIMESVRKFGYYNFKQAQEYIGKEGVKALELYGGWANLCEGLTCDNKGVVYSQLLGLVKAVRAMPKDYFDKRMEISEENKKLLEWVNE